MGRSKIKMELIQDHKKRKSTFVKRKACLVKKISELSILCGIKACMIIYEGNNQVEIGQNDPNEVEELINLYKNQSLENRSKRAKTLSSFFENDQKKKAEIQEEKYPTWDSRLDYLSEKELRNLIGVLEIRMENAKGKAEFLKSMKVQDSNVGSSSLCHQEMWDYPELMNNNLNLTSPWPISSFPDYNFFFQENIPNCGDYNFYQANIPNYVNSMGAGMDNELLDYQFGNGDYSMKIEAENWLENNGIGSSSTMQSLGNNGTDSSSIMEYSFIYNGSTDMPYGFQ
ncbi:unnamed protein product [Withania somnifera]